MTVTINPEEKGVDNRGTVEIQKECSPRALREMGWGALELKLVKTEIEWLNNVLSECQTSVTGSVMWGVKLGIITFPFYLGSSVVKYGLSIMIGFITGQLLYLGLCLQDSLELPPWGWSLYAYGGAILGLFEAAHGWSTVYNTSGIVVAVALGFTIRKEWSWRMPAMLLGAALSLNGSRGGLGTPVLWISTWIAFCVCLSFLLAVFKLESGPKPKYLQRKSDKVRDEHNKDNELSKDSDEELTEFVNAVMSELSEEDRGQMADEFAGTMAQLCKGIPNIQITVTPAANSVGGSCSQPQTRASLRSRSRSRSHSPRLRKRKGKRTQ